MLEKLMAWWRYNFHRERTEWGWGAYSLGSTQREQDEQERQRQAKQWADENGLPWLTNEKK